MAIFNAKANTTRTEKQEQKIQATLEKYGLDSLTDPNDIESVRQIARELMGTGLQETGMALSLQGKPYETLPVYYLRAILEQNWIIIRQLDRLNSHFDSLGRR